MLTPDDGVIVHAGVRPASRSHGLTLNLEGLELLSVATNVQLRNPLCPVCITGEVKAWLTFYPTLGNELLPKLEKYLERIENKIIDSTECIKCKNKRASVCPYCFIDYIIGELKKIGVNKFVFKEFLKFFSYDNEVPNPHKAKWARFQWGY